MPDSSQQRAAQLARVSAPGKGIALMLSGGLFLTMNDSIAKWLTGDYPVGEVLALRGIFVFIPIALLAWRNGGLTALRINWWRGHAARAGFMMASSFLFVTGLTKLPLADAIAFAFTGPLVLTALAMPLLGERVGWRRWLAVLAGFLGILVMLRPGTEAIRWAALFPIGATICGALRDILTRRMTLHESSTAILMTGTSGVILAGLCTLPFGWKLPTPGDFGMMALSGCLVGAAHFMVIESFRNAEATLVAPFKYFTMVWAVVLGFVIWGDLPNAATLAGVSLVIGSGVYILHRETRRRHPVSGGEDNDGRHEGGKR
ncbi:MAG: DMT family transporter [Alphaproteobacteria bacterium]|nr:DMT family transporter [Alphaproteobacteria bacterium]MDP6603369.1 DMT family transporter [Rhodospirillales bacterium]